MNSSKALGFVKEQKSFVILVIVIILSLIHISEPAELIATACAADVSYVRTSVDTIMNIDPNIGILVGGGINSGQDVYNVIAAGADATGSSSAIATARNPRAMIEEMLSAARDAWNERCGGVMMEG